jgi:pimeloyl-ACP methyl ester carboxylesterase
VEDLAGLIRESKLVKPVLMGHSMGASTVAAFAARYPDIPRAVILEDPGLARKNLSEAEGASRSARSGRHRSAAIIPTR